MNFYLYGLHDPNLGPWSDEEASEYEVWQSVSEGDEDDENDDEEDDAGDEEDG